MTTSTNPTSQAAAATIPPTAADLPFPEREFTTYRRALPRLLQEGHAQRYALIKGDEVLSIWDTHRDASQAGYERFGIEEPFAINKINPLDTQRFELLDAGKVKDLRQERSCPS